MFFLFLFSTHHQGHFSVLFFQSSQRSRKAARSLEKIARESLRAERERQRVFQLSARRFATLLRVITSLKNYRAQLATASKLYTLHSTLSALRARPRAYGSPSVSNMSLTCCGVSTLDFGTHPVRMRSSFNVSARSKSLAKRRRAGR